MRPTTNKSQSDPAQAGRNAAGRSQARPRRGGTPSEILRRAADAIERSDDLLWRSNVPLTIELVAHTTMPVNATDQDYERAVNAALTKLAVVLEPSQLRRPRASIVDWLQTGTFRDNVVGVIRYAADLP